MNHHICPVPDCQRRFLEKQVLDRHIKQDHRKLYTCPVCSKTFSFKSRLADHVKVLHKDVVHPYKCSYCAKGFGHFESFNKHVANVHEGKNEFKCQLCRPSTKVSS